ncbi:MAG: TonB-dependent receptor plug domain-containing protein [Asticcacaulis sp.]
MSSRQRLTASLLTTTILTALPAVAPLAVHAQTTSSGNSDIEVVVTATKRSEKLQNVPISIQALTTKKLDQLNVTNINSYVSLLPSVAFQNSPYQGSSIYFPRRGLGRRRQSLGLAALGRHLSRRTAGDHHRRPARRPYLRRRRIESLAGPQGTLYGASSEAGTIRIITNKPDTSGAYGRLDVEGNAIDHGGQGGKIEGMFNTPLGSKAALRVVGWTQHNAGYIDNVPGTRTFLGLDDGSGTGTHLPGITINNSAFVKKDFNTSDISGGRAALRSISPKTGPRRPA